MPIVTVPQLSDNYAYLVIDDGSKECAVVDCAEADKVIASAKLHGAKIVAVLTTHWHGDHSGGNNDIASKVPGIKVYGAGAEGGKIPALTNPVSDGDQVRIGALEGRVIGIPAHTNGHVAYYFPKLGAVFTGDTMFVGGCGRVFEGNAATMVASLKKLAALPDSTQVYCGHEYTEKNLRFALTLEPGNEALKKKHEWSVKANAESKFTVPSTIGDEKKTNPFLRTDSPELRANSETARPVSEGRPDRDLRQNSRTERSFLATELERLQHRQHQDRYQQRAHHPVDDAKLVARRLARIVLEENDPAIKPHVIEKQDRDQQQLRVQPSLPQHTRLHDQQQDAERDGDGGAEVDGRFEQSARCAEKAFLGQPDFLRHARQQAGEHQQSAHPEDHAEDVQGQNEIAKRRIHWVLRFSQIARISIPLAGACLTASILGIDWGTPVRENPTPTAQSSESIKINART